MFSSRLGKLGYLFLADLLDAPALSRYCTAAYWVVATMTSTGYGDIHGDSSLEMGEDKFTLMFKTILCGKLQFKLKCVTFNHLLFMQL